VYSIPLPQSRALPRTGLRPQREVSLPVGTMDRGLRCLAVPIQGPTQENCFFLAHSLIGFGECFLRSGERRSLGR